MFKATKRTLLYLILIFSSCSSSHLLAENPAESRIVWKSERNLGAAFEQARSKGIPLFIFFTGEPWCPPCMRYAKRYLDVQEVMSPLADQFIFIKIIYPPKSQRVSMSDQLKALKSNYQIEVFPTTLIVDSETHEQLFRFKGVPNCSPEEFPQFLIGKVKN